MRIIRNPERIFITFICIAILAAGMIGCGPPYVIQETEEARIKRLDKFQAIIPPGTELKLVFDGSRSNPRLTFAEGASWMDGKLYFTNLNFEDSSGNGLWVLNPDGSCRLINPGVTAVGTKPLPNGNLAVCYAVMVNGKTVGSVVEMTPESEIVKTIADSADSIPVSFPNDLITDRKGGIYFTDPRGGKEGRNLMGTSVYYVNYAGKVTRLTGWNEHRFPNGCVLSPDDSRFFLNDDTEDIWVFDVNDDGTLSNKRVFAKLIMHRHQHGKKIPKSLSDGMTIDRSGNLYVTSEIGIQVFDKNGELLEVIHVPKISSYCVFGGDDLSTLYITCRDQIYSIRTKVKGYQYPIR